MINIELEPMAWPAMQQAHEQEQALYRALAKGIDAKRTGSASDEELDAILAALLEHMSRHFDQENRLMFETGFPPYPAHAAEHRQVLDEVAATVSAWQQTRQLEMLVEHLLGRHLIWMRRHVATMDYLTARYLAMTDAQQKNDPKFLP